MTGEILQIESKTANEFLLPKHYSGRKPQISIAFGWFADGELKAVITYGKPASASLCVGVCGKENSEFVYELNRLCRLGSWEEPLSQFVSATLRKLKSKNWIIVSYADSEMNHNGYIYQACNFIYTGLTKSRTDKYTEGNKHSRHYDKSIITKRKFRSSKHRYIYFCGRNKKQNKAWKDKLKYPILPYPKNENKNYVLGDYLKPKIIESPK